MTLIPAIAKDLVQEISGISPVLSQKGGRKGQHVKYAFRFEYNSGSCIRHISIAKRQTEDGITTYVNKTSVNGTAFPEYEFKGIVRVTREYPMGYKGETGELGLSTAAGGLATLNPKENDVLRVSISSEQGFRDLLDWYFSQSEQKAARPNMASPIIALRAEHSTITPEEQEQFNEQTKNFKTDEKEALVKVRYGQGCFRDALIQIDGPKCWMTGIEGEPLLVASHIKPWSHCDEDRNARGNPDNGLLLSALWDAAFDAGLVTFGEDWQVITSDDLPASAGTALGRLSETVLPEQFRTTGRKAYLTYHRENVYEKWKKK